jgi:hypothetical protein
MWTMRSGEKNHTQRKNYEKNATNRRHTKKSEKEMKKNKSNYVRKRYVDMQI